MKDLSEYLNKFKVTLFKNEDKIEVMREIINTVTCLDLKPNDISIKGDCVYIQATPLYKNEIFLNKKKIIEKFKEKNLSYITELR